MSLPIELLKARPAGTEIQRLNPVDPLRLQATGRNGQIMLLPPSANVGVEKGRRTFLASHDHETDEPRVGADLGCRTPPRALYRWEVTPAGSSSVLAATTGSSDHEYAYLPSSSSLASFVSRGLTGTYFP
jgi:hypothetical protein